jgi:hypothetical protein
VLKAQLPGLAHRANAHSSASDVLRVCNEHVASRISVLFAHVQAVAHGRTIERQAVIFPHFSRFRGTFSTRSSIVMPKAHLRAAMRGHLISEGRYVAF